jgi:hypothetical protein
MSKLKGDELVEYIRVNYNFNCMNGDVFIKKTGKKLAAKNSSGYISHWFQYNKSHQYITAHLIVWVFTRGSLPVYTIDHKDRVRTNNCPSNLQDATITNQRYNTGISVRNSSGYKGVHFNKNSKKYQVIFAHPERGKVHGGYFSDVHDAGERYNELTRELHGDFHVPNVIDRKKFNVK